MKTRLAKIVLVVFLGVLVICVLCTVVLVRTLRQPIVTPALVTTTSTTTITATSTRGLPGLSGHKICGLGYHGEHFIFEDDGVPHDFTYEYVNKTWVITIICIDGSAKILSDVPVTPTP